MIFGTFLIERGGGEGGKEMIRKDREAVKKVKILDGRYGREVAKRKPQCTKERGWAIDKQTDTQTKFFFIKNEKNIKLTNPLKTGPTTYHQLHRCEE